MWREFVELAEKRQEPFKALCARFGVSRKTGYKWINRFRLQGQSGLQPQSRRPKTSPRKTPETVVEAVRALRRANPGWSVARLHEGLAALGVSPLPALSTVDLILRRERLAVAARPPALGGDTQRFEPNFRWLIEPGPPLGLREGTVVHPVIVRDEATGFWLAAALLDSEDDEALPALVEPLCRRHGLPWRIVLERPAPVLAEAPAAAHSRFTIWLIRQGVGVEFRPARLDAPPTPAAVAQRELAARLARLPDYQRTAMREDPGASANPLTPLVAGASQLTAAQAQTRLDQLRDRHNFGGRQAMLQRSAPVSLFRPGTRAWSARPPEPAPAAGAKVRLVSEKGILTFRRRLVYVGRAFAGASVEIEPTPNAGEFVVLFAGQRLGLVLLAEASTEATTSLLLQRG